MRSGDALLAGQVPDQLLLHAGIVNGQRCRAVGIVGHNSHLPGVCHGAQRRWCCPWFWYKGSGCGFPPAAHCRSGCTAQSGSCLPQWPGGRSRSGCCSGGCRPRLYTSAAVAAHLHKGCQKSAATASGSVMPVCCGQPDGWCQRDDGSIHKVFCARNGRPHCAGGKQDEDGQHRYDDDGAADAPCAHPGPGGFQIFDAPGRKRLPFGWNGPPRRILLMNGSPYRSYSTHFKNRPLAGRVGPARLRSRLSRMAGISAGSSRPAPASHKVPARMRTMLYR